MLKVRKFALLIVVAIIAAIISFAPAYSESAQSSNWDPNSQPDVFTLDDYTQPPECQEKQVKVPVRINWRTIGEQVMTKCFIETQYGSLSTDEYLQLPNTDYAYKLYLSNQAGHPIYIPNTNVLAYITSSGLKNYLHVYKDVAGRIIEVPGFNNDIKAYTINDSPDYQLESPLDDSLRIIKNGRGWSANGKYLVVEAAGNTLVRINLDTFDEFEVPAYLPEYGVGLNPNASIAVSNDGRYIAVSGSNVNELMITDTQICEQAQKVNPLNGISYDDCQLGSFTDILKQRLFGFTTASKLAFNHDATSLTMLAGGYGKYVALSATSGEAAPKLAYLALGDSFSSGEGDRDGAEYYVPRTDGSTELPEEKCHLSTRSYPFLLAAEAGLTPETSKSVACSGAETEDINGVLADDEPYRGQFKQYEKHEASDYEKVVDEVLNITFFPGRAAQIEFVKKYKPKVITLTIGGNDVGFGTKLQSCIGYTPQPFNPTCDFAIERKGTALEIQDQFNNLKDLYVQLQNASPKSQVYVLGYPKFFTQSLLCGTNVALDGLERDYITKSVMYMNQVIKAASDAAGVTYVNVEESLDGRNLCSLKPDAFNGITLGNDVGAWNINVIGRESYHPNETGHELMAQSILGQFPDLMERKKCDGQQLSCFNTFIEAPTIPDYFETGEDPVQMYLGSFIDRVVIKKDELINTGKELIDFTAGGLKSFTDVITEIHSDPVSLGEFEVDENGIAHISADIPDEVPFGYHTLHVYAIKEDGEKADFYQGFWYINSHEDADGDGVADTKDKCVFTCLYEASSEDQEASSNESTTDSTQNDGGILNQFASLVGSSTGQNSLTLNRAIAQSAAEVLGDASTKQPLNARVDQSADSESEDYAWYIALLAAVIPTLIIGGYLLHRHSKSRVTVL